MNTENKNKFRLPTKKEFDSLISNHSIWNEEKQGLEITNNKGEILFLPASCDRYDASNYGIGYGCYWSSTEHENSIYDAYYLYFDPDHIKVTYDNRDIGHTIRLVSNEPFEGGIEFGGIYWKQENEDGYYTIDEALEKFQ